MASIRPGTLGTFKASTAEGRALEIISFLQLQESDPAKNPNEVNAIVASIDFEDSYYRGSFTVPAEQSITINGLLTIAATPFLQGVLISAGGDDPTFKSAIPERYLLEVLMYLQGLERSSAHNPQSQNNIQGSYNSDSGLYQGTFQIPVTFALTDSGGLLAQAIPYLID